MRTRFDVALARPHLLREALLGAVDRAGHAGTTHDPSGSDRPSG